MFIAFRDTGAFHDSRGAIFHSAIARRSHRSGAVRTRDHLPSRSPAELAVLDSHCKKAYGRAARTASRAACEFLWMNPFGYLEEKIADKLSILFQRRHKQAR